MRVRIPSAPPTNFMGLLYNGNTLAARQEILNQSTRKEEQTNDLNNGLWLLIPGAEEYVVYLSPHFVCLVRAG